MLEKFQSRIVEIAGLSSLCLGLVGCSDSQKTKSYSELDSPMTPIRRKETLEKRLSEVRDVDGGVFVFPRSFTFPETLADFRKAHPEYKILSVTQGPDVTRNPYGYTEDSRADVMIVLVDWPISQR